MMVRDAAPGAAGEGRRAYAAGLWLFALAGPPIGEVLMLASLGAWPITPALVWSGLPVAYLFGLIPAWVVGAVDLRLVRRGASLPSRLAIAPVLGAVAGSLPLVPLYGAGLIRGTEPLILPAVAAATALLCIGLHLVVQKFA